MHVLFIKEFEAMWIHFFHISYSGLIKIISKLAMDDIKSLKEFLV